MPAFTVIDHTEIGSGGAASWSVSSIPSTYDHLLIKASVRSTKTGVDYDTIQLRFNGVSSNVYTDTYIIGNSATPASYRDTARPDIAGLNWPSAATTANTFGSLSIWIPHYANTTNYKQIIGDSVSENNSTATGDWALAMVAGLYSQTSAISSIEIKSGWLADHAQYSTFTLYGVTGA